VLKSVWGKLLRVNLTKKEIIKENIPEELFHQYIGGSGIATKYLYDEVPSGTNPFSEDNKVIFATGPFQGYVLPGGAKWSVVSRSPLTNTFGVTTAGAEWGVRMKNAGYDMIIIEGKSPEPLYLYINNDQVELKSAKNYWGKDAIETVGLIKNEIGNEKISVATIGTAGENGVGIGCIVADEHSFAGRCGFGAVLGSKKLKAIAISGTNKVPLAEPEKLKSLSKKLFKRLRINSEDNFTAHGTAVTLASCEKVGDLPIKYWTRSKWEKGAEEIGAPNFTDKLNAKSWPCMYCPVGCHRHVEFRYKGKKIEGAGAEYETLGMLGSNCLINDLDVISKANDLCNRLGMDTISAGSYIAFTMECYEKGILNQEDLDGLKANWGNGDYLLEMLKQIGWKEGFGAIFAGGIRPAAKKIGEAAERLTVEVKNLDFPAHDPRSYFTLAINYATSTRGACHLRGYPHVGEGGTMLIPEMGFDQTPERFTMEGKAEITALFQDIAALHDSLVICIFIPVQGMSLTETTKLFNYATGLNMTPQELMKVGERIVNLQRQINVEDGIDIEDDGLPAKMFEPGKKGFRKNQIPEPFEETLLKYYELRGWDGFGKPTNKKLSDLGIK